MKTIEDLRSKWFDNKSIKVRMMGTFVLVIFLLLSINLFSIYKNYE